MSSSGGFPGTTWRNLLRPGAQHEADEFTAQLEGFLSSQHGPDGSHRNLRTNTINVTESLRLSGYATYSVRVDDPAALSDGPRYSVYRLQSTAARSITGITVSQIDQVMAGHVLVLVNGSAFVITLAAGTRTASKILTPSGLNVALGPEGTAWLFYDQVARGWRVLAATGQAWVDVPHGDLTFTAATGTWTVAAGDLSYCKYLADVSSRRIYWKGSILTSSVSAGTSELRVSAPPGITFGVADSFGTMLYSQDLFATQDIGQAIARQATDLVAFRTRTAAAWAITTDQTAVIWNVTIEID